MLVCSCGTRSTFISSARAPRSMSVHIDPSYAIRSVPATPSDSAFCLLLGQSAVHAGMSGRQQHGRELLEPPVHPRPHFASPCRNGRRSIRTARCGAAFLRRPVSRGICARGATDQTPRLTGSRHLSRQNHDRAWSRRTRALIRDCPNRLPRNDVLRCLERCIDPSTPRFTLGGFRQLERERVPIRVHDHVKPRPSLRMSAPNARACD